LNTATISFPLFGDGFVLNLPSYITIFGFNIYLYGLLVTSGFALAAIYLLKRHKIFSLTKDNILDLVILSIPSGLIGARLFYILFNFSSYFGPGKWLNIILVREGGLAVYGGVIGGAIAFIVYSRIKKIHIGRVLDAAGFGLFIGQAVGRWGNLFNREAFGVETDLPWRMGLVFERDVTFGSLGRTFIAGVPYYFHPAFLYEILWNAAGLLIMHIFSKKHESKYPGKYFLFYVAWYGLGRLMIEGIRVDSLFLSGTDIRVSQLLAALSFVTATALLVRNHIKGGRALEETLEANADACESEDDADTDLESGEAEDNTETTAEFDATPLSKDETTE